MQTHGTVTAGSITVPHAVPIAKPAMQQAVYDPEAQLGSDPEAQLWKPDPVALATEAVRAGFIRKVYGLLSIQLVVTAAAAALFMFEENTRQFVLSTPACFYIAMFAPLGLIIALQCYRNKHPTNLILLGLFTLCEGYTVGVICAAYYEVGAGMIVLQAVILTAAVFLSLTAFVLVTKKDFSWLGAGLFAVLMVLIVWGILNMFFNFGPISRTIYSLIGALLFAGYILFDTSQLLHRLGPDDYIEGCISLYLDVINLFLYLLQLLQSVQGD